MNGSCRIALGREGRPIPIRAEFILYFSHSSALDDTMLKVLLPSRLSLSSVTPARLPPTRHVSSQFPRPSPFPRILFRRPAFWLLPVLGVGGVSVYLYPNPQPILSQLVSSSALIPCPSHESPTSHDTLILSPSEHTLSLSDRLRSFFIDRIWEPVLTARRFIHLFILFVPVILSSPMLLVGSPEERLKGDRWGAVWWYNFLVAQLDRAGPTFIKVRHITLLHTSTYPPSPYSWLSGRPRARIYFPLYCANVWARCTLKDGHILLHTQNAS